MTSMIFYLSFKQTFLASLQILLMGGCGYFLVKKNVLDSKGLDILSGLLINFFLPQLIIYEFTQTFSFNLFPRWWLLPLLSVAVVTTGYFVSRAVAAVLKEDANRKELSLLVMFHNSAYLPLILVSAIFFTFFSFIVLQPIITKISPTQNIPSCILLHS